MDMKYSSQDGRFTLFMPVFDNLLIMLQRDDYRNRYIKFGMGAKVAIPHQHKDQDREGIFHTVVEPRNEPLLFPAHPSGSV